RLGQQTIGEQAARSSGGAEPFLYSLSGSEGDHTMADNCGSSGLIIENGNMHAARDACAEVEACERPGDLGALSDPGVPRAGFPGSGGVDGSHGMLQTG